VDEDFWSVIAGKFTVDVLLFVSPPPLSHVVEAVFTSGKDPAFCTTMS
jgi:hypothetical protein